MWHDRARDVRARLGFTRPECIRPAPAHRMPTYVSRNGFEFPAQIRIDAENAAIDAGIRSCENLDLARATKQNLQSF